MISEKDIEFVARRMCEHVGLDPDSTVETGETAAMTRMERSMTGGWCSDVAWVTPRWRLFRRDAEAAIASHLALKDWEAERAA